MVVDETRNRSVARLPKSEDVLGGREQRTRSCLIPSRQIAVFGAVRGAQSTVASVFVPVHWNRARLARQQGWLSDSSQIVDVARETMLFVPLVHGLRWKLMG